MSGVTRLVSRSQTAFFTFVWGREKKPAPTQKKKSGLATRDYLKLTREMRRVGERATAYAISMGIAGCIKRGIERGLKKLS